MEPEMFRVQKLLSLYGYCSRRKGDEFIAAGRVKVNGQVVSLGDKASKQDEISVDGKKVDVEKKRYIIFHKPVECVTALTDKHLPTIMEYINIKERVFPVGRLDYLTSGLLLLTNDGDFANQIMHPRYEVKKTYRAELGQDLSDKDIVRLKTGVELEDGKTAPAIVKRISKKIFEITIHQGKNRIVRRMIKKLGYGLRFLERVKVGDLTLGNLTNGKFRDLTEEEKQKIFK